MKPAIRLLTIVIILGAVFVLPFGQGMAAPFSDARKSCNDKCNHTLARCNAAPLPYNTPDTRRGIHEAIAKCEAEYKKCWDRCAKL